MIETTEETYFLIECSEDGDVRVRHYTRATLEKYLAEDLSERSEYEPPRSAPEYFDTAPGYDPQEWGDSRLLIKGRIVRPRAAEVVTKLEVP